MGRDILDPVPLGGGQTMQGFSAILPYYNITMLECWYISSLSLYQMMVGLSRPNLETSTIWSRLWDAGG